MRSVFIITPSIMMSEPSAISAATIGKAAEEGSPGTTTGEGRSSGWPVRVMRRPASPCGSTITSAPKWRSMRSVWSREASLSITVVRPGALRPASSTADLICAEATGVWYSIGAAWRAPSSLIGQRPPSACAFTCAPISARGSRMRRIGRLRSEASPSKVAEIGWPPTTPIISLVPVPALPKSSVASGSASPPMPTPCTLQRPSPWRSTAAPSWRQACAVRSTSSPSSRPSIFVSPMERRPRIRARCEIDLSPGTRTRPSSAPAPSAAGSVCFCCGHGRSLLLHRVTCAFLNLRRQGRYLPTPGEPRMARPARLVARALASVKAPRVGSSVRLISVLVGDANPFRRSAFIRRSACR